MAKKFVFFEAVVWLILFAACFFYFYKTNKNFRIFLHNKTKDTRIFMQKDLPKSKYVLQDTIESIPDVGNSMAQSVGQAYFVYNEVGQYWGEGKTSSNEERDNIKR